MKRLVRVSLDGSQRCLAVGMKVRHLLSEDQILRVERGDMAVTDERGRERGLEGALIDGSRLHLRRRHRNGGFAAPT